MGALGSPILTLRGGLSVGASQGHHTLIHLDAHHHAPVLDQLGELLALIGFLVESLVEENYSADAGCHTVISGEEKLAVEATVFLCVFGIDALKALSDAA